MILKEIPFNRSLQGNEYFSQCYERSQQNIEKLIQEDVQLVGDIIEFQARFLLGVDEVKLRADLSCVDLLRVQVVLGVAAVGDGTSVEPLHHHLVDHGQLDPGVAVEGHVPD